MIKLFLDTETTGLEAEDRLVEVSYKPIGKNIPKNAEVRSARFKAPVPIKIAAMAVNHITNKMIQDCELFIGSPYQEDLQSFREAIVVAHNAPFDLAMLAKEGVYFDNYIDTKKMSHALDPEQEMESHRLQYLRYYYGVELPDAIAHTAEGDVAVLIAVFNKLYELLGNPTDEELIELSKRPVLYRKFTFGKYKGQHVGQVAAADSNYLEWLLKEKKATEQKDEDWIYTLEHYLRNSW